jgi:hypothetical protein
VSGNVLRVYKISNNTQFTLVKKITIQDMSGVGQYEDDPNYKAAPNVQSIINSGNLLFLANGNCAPWFSIKVYDISKREDPVATDQTDRYGCSGHKTAAKAGVFASVTSGNDTDMMSLFSY